MNDFSIKLFASRECPICEFNSAINIKCTKSSVVLECQTCRKQYFYKRVEHITNDLIEMEIQQ